MIFWMIGFAFWTVWFVFHDPAIDLRMVAIGVVLPNVLILHGAYVAAHSVVVIATAMAIVMLLTKKNRALRRRLIFVVFGMFLSLVFDAAWVNTHLFWWPVAGTELPPILHAERMVGILAAQELVGIALTVGFLARFHVFESGNWQYFFRTGRLPIDVGRPVTFGARPSRKQSRT